MNGTMRIVPVTARTKETATFSPTIVEKVK